MQTYIRYELNVTLACNARCKFCNRMCDQYPDRTEHMTLGQVRHFVEQLRARPAYKVKVVGGEPLCHPQFAEIYTILLDAAKEGLIGQLKVNTNCTIRPPTDIEVRHPKVRWQGTTPARHTYHLPYCVAPSDLGETPTNPGWQCAVPRRCGASLDYYGWLPCSAAIMIVRLWGFWDLYRHELPSAGWGWDQICHLCPLSMPLAWQKALPRDLTTSPTWAAKIASYDGVTPLEPYPTNGG
jgi:hypothetical protein